MLPTTEIECDGVKYDVRALDAIECSRLWFRLLKCIGPGLSAIDASNPSGSLPALVGKTIENMPIELMDQLRDTFAKCCCVIREDGKKPELRDVFKEHFARKPMALTNWILEVAKVQFSDFLPFLESMKAPSSGVALVSKSPTE